MIKTAVAVEGWRTEAAIAFALAARRFASTVTLTRAGESANGKDDIEVMTLAPEPGEEVMLAVDGSDEKEAFTELLAKLLDVIAPPEDRLAAVTGPGAASQRDHRRPRTAVGVTGFTGSRIAEIAELDVEEAAPVHYRKRMRRRTGQLRAARAGRVQERVDSRIGRDAKPPRRKKDKFTQRKSKGSARQKPTSSHRKPRKPKK